MQREITPIWGKKKVLLRETKRAVTPFGGLSVFFEFLGQIGYAQVVRESVPFQLSSPNAIDPAHTFTAFVVSVLAGARRFAHASLLRADRALHALLGMPRFPTDDTIRNFFRRFTMGQVYRFFEPLWEWQIERLPRREEGYTLDLDSTVFERYGRQEGARRGYNPKKRGRPSHHPLLAVLAEAHFVLHGWLRSGDCGSARGVVEFLKETLARWDHGQKIRRVRADTGFFDQKLLKFLEGRHLSYIVAAKLTRWVKREAIRVEEWQELDEFHSAGEFRVQLWGWDRERRFVAVRERLREKKHSLGRRLLEVPGYTFRVFVTNCGESPQEIWREYNQRADVENRVAELKYDLAADDFCMKPFFATEAAFLSVLFLFNLLSEFQRACGRSDYRQPATLRTEVFLCGAILGRVGHRKVLHLSAAWGGLEQRNPLIDKILSYVFVTSPKFAKIGST